ncbi:MAG: response regulator, partial [PVC group bacterium]|nr:response regulator [PVC group bacterium]
RESIDNSEIDLACGGNESILVVDDDELQREVSSKLLQRLGYKVSTVESGEEAIRFMNKIPQDVLILDMVMPPGIDGTETYRQIRKIYPGQKAIVVSGFSESDRVIEIQKMGVKQFIKKPFTANVLAMAIRSELDII